MPECNHKGELCSCVNWKKEDLTVQVNFLMNHFEFTGFELEYTTLEPEENRRLCKVGRCRACGKRLCLGTGLPVQATVYDLLAAIYRWMFQMWYGPRERLPEGAECFSDMFLSLFHEPDRTLVSEWLDRQARSIGEGL